MGFKNRVASEYIISASGIESFMDSNFEVFLEDTETNDLVNLVVYGVASLELRLLQFFPARHESAQLQTQGGEYFLQTSFVLAGLV